MTYFKLGIVERTSSGLKPFSQRDLTEFTKLNTNKPTQNPSPRPNLFYTPIDNREQILEKMRKEIEYNLERHKMI